jgi:hypothetical protein
VGKKIQTIFCMRQSFDNITGGRREVNSTSADEMREGIFFTSPQMEWLCSLLSQPSRRFIWLHKRVSANAAKKNKKKISSDGIV